ncbi:hypothetical protein KDM41_08820 [bacterium]|nr:hypothetical protein [bacterium]
MLRTDRNRNVGSGLVTAFLLLLLLAQTAAAGNVNGVVKLGTVIKDEDARNMAAIQETYNVYEGFSVSQVRLTGTSGSRGSFLLDLQEINRDSGKGLFTWRVQDLGKLTVRYGQHRQLYDADGSVSSQRRDWRVGVHVTPSNRARITANFGYQTREGDRLGYPAGTTSVLGGNYDYNIFESDVEAEYGIGGGRRLAVGWRGTSFTDDLNDAAERSGNVLSVRASGPCYFFPELLSHYVRAAYGKQELVEPGLDYTMSNFQYLGLLRPARDLQFKYRFLASRVEDEAETFQTDEFRNDFDLTWYHKYGRVFGGYGYVTRDDYTLTDYNDWRAGFALNHGKVARLQVSYAASEKGDQEERTLLKDIEASRLKASFKSEPVENLTLGLSYAEREREYTVLDVEAEGVRYSAFGRLERPGLGAVSVDYTYSEDDYQDRAAGFYADNRSVSARVDLTAVRNLDLAAGLTYLNIGGDLDIEKSILMFEGEYTVARDYFVQVKYNVYNYDDYLLLDRYYTANVVWLNVGYKLSID